MPPLRRLACWPSSTSDDAIIIETADHTWVFTQAQLAGFNESRLQNAVDVQINGTELEGKVWVHKNDDGSIAIAVGDDEPSYWPEDMV